MFENGLLYRVDILAKIMREETILDFLNECWNNNRSSLDKMVSYCCKI